MKHTHVFAIAAILLSKAANAADFSNTRSVEALLESGKIVSAVVDLGLCRPVSSETPAANARGGFRINSYRETDDGTLAFADDRFTINQDGNPIRQFVRYRIYADSSAEISMTTFSMPEMRQIGSVIGYKCGLGRGLSFSSTPN